LRILLCSITRRMAARCVWSASEGFMVDAVSVTKVLWAYYAAFLLGGTGQWESPYV
jgi:hypothetical protein